MSEKNESTPKILIITGASRGIGAATAICAAREGYSVCVNYCSSEEQADTVVNNIKVNGGTAFSCQADISQEKDVIRLIEQTVSQYGKIDGLVNNAGIVGSRILVSDITADVLHKTFSANVYGTILCCREAMKHMAASGGGAIVNVSSQSAITGGRNLSHYAASKGAINSFTVGFAREAREQGVRVNAVSPGRIETEMNQASATEASKSNSSFGRVGTPDEVARMVLWLLSDAASYVSGTVIPVNGAQ